MESRPLSEGNALQRAYARWATPYYDRLSPDLREQAELLDRFLYSRRGLGVWLGLAGAVAGTTFGLVGLGLPLGLAALVAVLTWSVLPGSLLVAWVQPALFSATHLGRKLPRIMGLGLLGAVCGFTLGHVVRHGGLDLEQLANSLWKSVGVLIPAALGVAAAMLAVMWGVARVRRDVLERQLERERLGRERDLAARQAAEAQLKLLQAQIQPHFIFNTLAALQHWVDSSDPRAGPLLRALTAFLRGSTELLGRDQVSLGAEADIVRHYLQIMQARLGERLQYQVEIEPGCAAEPLPPGLLLTLVENAIEHGISPTLGGGRVTVDASRQADGSLRVAVRDDGAGLPAGWQDGTGLANCRERLRHHGRGTLTLASAAPGTEALLVLDAAPPRGGSACGTSGATA
jgi:signal transduction histidine kinase